MMKMDDREFSEATFALEKLMGESETVGAAAIGAALILVARQLKDITEELQYMNCVGDSLEGYKNA